MALFHFLIAAIWMDLEIIILSQSNREKQISYNTTYVEYTKYRLIYLQNRNKPKKQTYGYQSRQ